MKKQFLLMAIMFVFCENMHGTEITYIVTQDTHLMTQARVITGSIREGETIFFQGKIDALLPLGSHEYMLFVMTKYGQEGWVNARHVMLLNNYFLPASVSGRFWIHSYYQQFLAGAQRETLFYYEPFWRDEYYELTRHLGRHQDPWWEFAGRTKFIIRDNLVQITGIPINGFISFATITQRKYDNTIILYVLCEHKSNFVQHNYLNSRFNEGKTYRLTLVVDGDYMDIFVGNDTKSMVTLIGVDNYFARSVSDFFIDGTVDLSRIVWPRRADGTMDFPPPGIDMSGFESSHTTTDRLRIRDNPATDSLIVTTLDLSAEVQVLETGPVETIGETTAPWARVLTASGFTGWAFSGSLEPIALAVEPEAPDPIIAEAPDEQPVPIAVATPTGQPMPLWALPMLVGGVAVAVVLVVLVKRKK